MVQKFSALAESGFEPQKDMEKIFRNLLLQNHLAQMLEIWYVTLLSGTLPNLFKCRSQGPKWSNPSGVLGSQVKQSSSPEWLGFRGSRRVVGSSHIFYIIICVYPTTRLAPFLCSTA